MQHQCQFHSRQAPYVSLQLISKRLLTFILSPFLSVNRTFRNRRLQTRVKRIPGEQRQALWLVRVLFSVLVLPTSRDKARQSTDRLRTGRVDMVNVVVVYDAQVWWRRRR